jgi:hypothetical protein
MRMTLLKQDLYDPLLDLASSANLVANGVRNAPYEELKATGCAPAGTR